MEGNDGGVREREIDRLINKEMKTNPS